MGTLYIEPGSPWENAYSESFISRFRDELFDHETFGKVAETKVLIEQYRLAYNHRCLHSSLGYMTPGQLLHGSAVVGGFVNTAAANGPSITCEKKAAEGVGQGLPRQILFSVVRRG
jgi:hypothetical protein